MTLLHHQASCPQVQGSKTVRLEASESNHEVLISQDWKSIKLLDLGNFFCYTARSSLEASSHPTSSYSAKLVNTWQTGLLLHWGAAPDSNLISTSRFVKVLHVSLHPSEACPSLAT